MRVITKKKIIKKLFFLPKTILKKSLEANKLVEEFMLLANKKVAEVFVKNKQLKGVYRIHDQPDEQKIITLERVIKKLGYNQQLKNTNNLNTQLNSLLKQTNNSPEENLIDTLVIRSMSKAKYSTNNIGHFGLAFEKYTHFTSPIRRYPDVIVHRILEGTLMNQTPNQKDLEEESIYCSHREERATKAERASIKYMQVKYMQNHKEDKFLGVISGVTEWGMYVEIIENKCEGMIRIRDIKGDFYKFDTEQYALIGDRTKTKYQLGDQVEVQVKKADLLKRHLDFVLS